MLTNSLVSVSYETLDAWRDKLQHADIATLHSELTSEVTDLIIQGGAKKNGATLSHCKYSENSMTELRVNW